MPGAYTHLTMADKAAESRALEPAGFDERVCSILGRWQTYVRLGAVSPDLPFVHFPPANAQDEWGNDMHHRRTDSIIRNVIANLRARCPALPAAPAELEPMPKDWEKVFSWLLGYTAHVVMDCTLHPVVNLRVGTYEDNKTEHRKCEMNQDVFVFAHLNLSVGNASSLRQSIGQCEVDGKLDPAIATIWGRALSECHSGRYEATTPMLDRWFASFVDVTQGAGDDNNPFTAIGRHILPGFGLTYPKFADLDYSYLKGLKTPRGNTMDFKDLFEEAKANVVRTWRVVAHGALNIDNVYETALQHCNLDTGEDDAGTKIYWR